MGADIHASIEYIDTYETSHSPLVMTFAAKLNLDRAYSIFGMLGYVGRDLGKSLVPARGYPDGMGWGFQAESTALVLRGGAAANVEFDSRGQYRESDGVCLSEEGAERWLKYGSRWLDEWRSDYRRISNPDIHSVNWITPDEYAKVVAAASRERSGDAWGQRTMAGYRAVLDAMRALSCGEIAGVKREVRLVYGFDN